MNRLARSAARLSAVLLALLLCPAFARAQDAAPMVHPWKMAYAKRMAREMMEARETRERREREHRLEARRAKAPATGKGLRAKRAPEDLAMVYAQQQERARTARRLGANAFSTPGNVLVNDRSTDNTQSGQSETSIVAFGDKLVAAWNDFSSAQDDQGYATSTDGGLTWTDEGTPPHVPGLTQFKWISDPVLAVNDKTGAIYFTALCDYLDGNLNAQSGVGIIKGRFNGTSFVWGTPSLIRNIAFTGSDGLDKQWVVADSSNGRVYVSYSRFTGGLSRIEAQAADSNAVSWSAPQQISLENAAEVGFVQGSRPVVDGDGRVYVVYFLIGPQFSDYYRISRSTNAGLSFSTPVTAESLYTNFGTGAPGFNRPNGVEFPGVAVDRSHGVNRGRIYLSWAESINWLDDVGSLGTSGDKPESETNNNIGSATPFTIGQTVRGSLSSLSDVDYFSVALNAGEHIVIGADSVGGFSQDAMRLRLIAPNGTTSLTYTTIDYLVNTNPGDPAGLPAGWLFTAPTTGTYYVRVSSLASFANYRLRTGLVDRTSERSRDQRDVFVGWSDDGVNWAEPVRVSEDPVGFDAFVPEVTVAPDGGLYSAWYDFRDAPAGSAGGHAGVYLARSGDGGATWTTLGAVADTLTDWSNTLTNIEPNMGDYIALTASAASVWPCWADGRRGNPDVFTASVPLIPNGAQVSFVNVQLGFNRIAMDWSVSPADTLTMRLYRSVDGGAYQYLDLVQFSTLGTLSYADTTVTGNHIYAYRLGRFTNTIELFYGQVRVFLPNTFPLRLASTRPNPVVSSSFGVSFSLASNDPAVFLLHDIAGREVFRQPLSLGMGPHTMTLSIGSGLKQGLYVLTLRQGGRNASTRVHLVR